jgi:hypothetical protein
MEPLGKAGGAGGGVGGGGGTEKPSTASEVKSRKAKVKTTIQNSKGSSPSHVFS